MLNIAAFEQGQHEGHEQPKMSRHFKATVLLYHQSNSEGQMKPWEVVNASSLAVDIQAGPRVGICTPFKTKDTGSKKNKEATVYLCVPFHEILRLLLPG